MHRPSLASSLAATLAAVLVGGVLTAVAPRAARADVVPPGQRYVPATHSLVGAASVGDRKLYLVTTAYRGVTKVRGGVTDGPLDVPSGYMSASYLVALTPAQVQELDALRHGGWEERPDAEGKTPLRDFLRRKDVAASPGLYARELVDNRDPRDAVSFAWRLDGVKDDALVLVRLDPATRQDGGSSGVQAGLGLGALVVGAVALARRRRA